MNASIEDMKLRGWMKKFPTAFEGEGNISGYKCHISLKHNYKAVADTRRPILVACQRVAREELEHVQRRGTIERVDEPTEFVSHRPREERKSKGSSLP